MRSLIVQDNQSNSEQAEYYKRLNQRMDEQDQKLDKLLEYLKKIEIIGLQMGKQLDEQNDLLDHLDKNLDATLQKTKKNTEIVERIDRQTGRCLMM